NGVFARVALEQGCAFRMPIVDEVRARRARPGVAGVALVRLAFAAGDVQEAVALVTQSRADAVRARVAAADDDDVFPLGVDVVAIREVGVQQAFRRRGE